MRYNVPGYNNDNNNSDRIGNVTTNYITVSKAMLDNTRIQTVTEEELKDIVIQDYLDHCYYHTYYIKPNGNKFDIYPNKTEDCYRLEILPGYWLEQFNDYCYQNTQDYYEDKNVTEEEKEDTIERMREDNDQYRDFLYCARDHFDIDDETKEIIF